MSRVRPSIFVLCTGFLLATGCGEVGGEDEWMGLPAGTNQGPQYTPEDCDAYEEATPGELCEQAGDAALCGENRVTFCDTMSDPEDLQWGPCLLAPAIECIPGTVVEQCNTGSVMCELFGGVPAPSDDVCVDIPGEEATPSFCVSTTHPSPSPL